MTDQAPDDLVTLTTAETPFAAEALRAALAEAGVAAVALSIIDPAEGGVYPPLERGVSVQVRRADLDHAREILSAGAEALSQLDWNEIDPPGGGGRGSRGPRRGKPPLVWIAWAVAVALLLIMAVAAIVILILEARGAAA